MEHGLAVNLLKSEFHVEETIFLVHAVNDQEVKMDTSKLKTMSKQPIPAKKKEAEVFLGFPNYYRQFIVNYNANGRPLVDLTKNVPLT